MKMVIADRDRGKKFYAVRCGDDVPKGFAGAAKLVGEGSARGFVIFLLVTSVLVLTVFPFAARAAQVTLAWNASAGPNLAGYNVYYGTASRDYDWSRRVGNVTTYTISDLASGVPLYCFAVKAYNTSGQESDYSNEVCTSTSSTCSYAISPTSASYTASGGTGSVAVTTQSGCTWTASSGAAWLTITSGGSGSGNGTIGYSVAANTGTSSRSASSTFAKNVFSVTQAGTGTTPTQSSLVIDDGQSGTTPVGTWRTSSGASPYGGRSLYIYSTTATYTFAASRSGAQAVYLWWTTHSSRSSSIPVRIYTGSTRLATVYVNQKRNGGRWNYLGTYTFSGQARVQIAATSNSYTTCADAVRFVP